MEETCLKAEVEGAVKIEAGQLVEATLSEIETDLPVDVEQKQKVNHHSNKRSSTMSCRWCCAKTEKKVFQRRAHPSSTIE